MEYTQWEITPFAKSNSHCVLILVVMEYTQWEGRISSILYIVEVLILVVMEYTQWVFIMERKEVVSGLNPCCNGIYSMSWWISWRWCQIHVLILVVMEYTQWGKEKK